MLVLVMGMKAPVREGGNSDSMIPVLLSLFSYQLVNVLVGLKASFWTGERWGVNPSACSLFAGMSRSTELWAS